MSHEIEGREYLIMHDEGLLSRTKAADRSRRRSHLPGGLDLVVVGADSG